MSLGAFHKLKISDVTLETDQAICVGFKVPNDLKETFQFYPGQYLTLRADIDGR